MAGRMIQTDITREDEKIEGSLRPQTLDDYIGQSKIKENLRVYIEAARQRGDALDHVLFYGPPGLGKTTLAGIIANEMGTHLKVTSGPAIEKPGEMAAILNNLEEGDLLFVDEIHRLNRQVEPGYGGLLYRYHDWKRLSGPVGAIGTAEVYPGWCNHKGRSFDRSLTGSFRYDTSSGVLQCGRITAYHYALRSDT